MKRIASVIEVGLRDGLQTHPRILPTNEKLDILDKIVKAGLKEIEVASFVNPKLVPQLSDSKEISKKIGKYWDVNFSALVPNERGYQEMIESKNIKEMVMFVSVSDTFNKKNINVDKKGAFEKFKKLGEMAKKDKIKIRGSISCCFDCPYEGQMKTEDIVDVVKMYKDIGVDRIDIADTIGSGNGYRMLILLDEVLKEMPAEKITGHFHDTHNTALGLVEASLMYGVTTFHSSISGLGGCPFSSKRVGNLSTEKLIEYLHLRGYQTGVDLEEIQRIKIK
jgi:hydroxymethylglutaryl-CoA lyase